MKEPSLLKPTVLIFKETLLPVSETFIEAQAGHLSSFVPQYIGLGRVVPSLTLPPDSILLTSGHPGFANLAQKVYRRLGIAPRFHREAANAKAQLIHAHFASGGRSALPLARHLRIPLIVTLHGSDVTTRINFRQRYRNLWREASLFICVSDFIRRRAAEVGFPEDKLRTLYIGVDRDIFRPRAEPKQRALVLFVGRLVEKKGCTYLLQAMVEVQKTHPEVQTVVIGDGPLRHSLETFAKQLGTSCKFLGSQPAPVVRQWLATARLFCAPSVTASNGDSEGLGMVFVEAQAMGTPVATFNHGGVPEIVLHGRTGLLAAEGNSNALASHISRFLENDVFWSQCGQQGIAWVERRFDVKRQTQQLEHLYADVCQSTRKRTTGGLGTPGL